MYNNKHTGNCLMIWQTDKVQIEAATIYEVKVLPCPQ